MAENSKDELNNKKEQLQVEKEITKEMTAREKFRAQSLDSASKNQDIVRSITEDIKDQLGMRRAMSETDKTALSLARQLQNSVQILNSSFDGQAAVKKQLVKDQQLLNSIELEIRTAIKGMDAQQVADSQKIADAQLENLKALDDIEKIKNEILYLDGEDKKLAQQAIKEAEDLVKKNDIFLEKQDKGLVASTRRVTQLKQQKEITDDQIKQRKEELEIQKKIEERTGVTGALVEGVGGIMQRLGMRSGIFQTAMSEASEAMKEMAEEAERGDKNYTKAQIALKGMTKLAKGFGKALTDPLSITLAILDGFFKVDAATTKVQRLTGQNSMELAGMNDRLATSVDFLEVTAELTEQMGMNAQNAFSPNVIAQAAELKNVMGLAANEAAGLATIAQTTVGDVDGVTDSVVGTVSAFNKANRSAVSQGVVLKDVATAAADIKASFAGNPEQLAAAASAARRMGLELSKVDQIASSLMDFESSIEAELEAQLLTGKSINMAKARELALNNDLAGLGNEIFKNSADINEFGKMNRIQQEAQAKALGISREELGKIAYARAIEAGMTEEAAEAAAGVTAEDMKRLEAQEAIQLAVAKLQQAFAPLLSVVSDIAQGIASFITPFAKFVGMATSTPFGKLAVGAAVLLKVFGGFGGIIGGVVKGTQSMIKGFGDYVSKVKGSKGILEKAKAFLGIGGKGAEDKVKENTKKIQDKTSKTDKPGGKGSNGLKGLAKGLKAMGAKGVLKGIGNLALSVVPLTLMVAAVPALIGLAAFGVGAGIGLTGLGKGLQAFGEAMKALGPAGLGYAAAGLALLTVSLIGVGYALKLAAPAFEAIGLAIKSAFEGIGSIITAAAEGIATILKEVTLEKAVALVAVGGAFAALGLGLASLGASLIFGMAGIGVLGGIAAMASPLSVVGTSLTAIAAGIAAISAALSTLETEKLDEIKDLVITTAFAAPMVAASGAITSLINGITGGDGDSKSDPAMIEKLDAILAAIKQGGDVYIDGNKAGQSLMLASNKSA